VSERPTPRADEQRTVRAESIAPAREGLCLITGATGFIGGHLARGLLREGYAVRCLARQSSDTSRLQELDVQIAVGDLTHADSLAAAVAGADYVLHCGALVSDWATTREIVSANVQGTRNLLAASLGASVRRFIHLSTTDVYGHPENTRIDESYTAARFRNWYAQTKLDAEAEVRRAARTSALDHAHDEERALETVVLRPATVYGPGSADVVGEIARAIRGGHMLLVDGGRAPAGLCYVENLTDAALLALRHAAAPGHAFNVSDGVGVTWKQFTDDLAEGLGCAGARWSLPYWLASGIGFSLEHGYRLLRGATGLSAPPLLSRQAVQVLGRSQEFTNRKLRELLGWEPRVDYAAGLATTLDWLRREYFEPA
jgi:nucleoside-diphosphate-sugar epimerase